MLNDWRWLCLNFFIATETLVINRDLLREEKKKSIPLLFLKGKNGFFLMKLWKSPKCKGKE